MSETELMPCPFCGGDAELDTMRGYRALSTGRIGNAVAIYCLSCSADMTMCHADHSGLTIEDMVYSLTEAWNRRSPVAEGGGSGAQVPPMPSTAESLAASGWRAAIEGARMVLLAKCEEGSWDSYTVAMTTAADEISRLPMPPEFAPPAPSQEGASDTGDGSAASKASEPPPNPR